MLPMITGQIIPSAHALFYQTEDASGKKSICAQVLMRVKITPKVRFNNYSTTFIFSLC